MPFGNQWSYFFFTRASGAVVYKDPFYTLHFLRNKRQRDYLVHILPNSPIIYLVVWRQLDH